MSIEHGSGDEYIPWDEDPETGEHVPPVARQDLSRSKPLVPDGTPINAYGWQDPEEDVVS